VCKLSRVWRVSRDSWPEPRPLEKGGGEQQTTNREKYPKPGYEVKDDRRVQE